MAELFPNHPQHAQWRAFGIRNLDLYLENFFAPDGTFQNVLGGLATFQRLAGLTNSTGTGASLWATDSVANSGKKPWKERTRNGKDSP